jgi:hypothetical protein
MSNIRFVNLSNYTTPEVKEYRDKDWVAYGESNNYFQYLIDRYNGSATNNAIINGISELIYGKGLDATDSSRKPDEYAQMKSLFSKDCLRKVTADLKMMGQCAFQVIYSKDHSRVTEVFHMPIESLRAEKCNEEGDIEAYYYAKDWSAVKDKKETPMRIPAFGYSNEGIEILYIRPYRAGFYYYSPVDYQGGLQYAELEEEVANYHLNNIKNGMSPSMLINFNNGVPTEEERYMIESRIGEKFSGTSNAGKFILAFNDNKEMSATIEPVQLSDASDQYQFLADEAMRKLMVAHRVTSPMLLGIKDQSGLGNNAEELKTASTLFDNTIIRPFQEMILDGVDKILAFNDISLNLYFKTLQPLEFQEDVVVDQETQEEETGVKLSSQEPTDEYLDSAFNELEALGEVIDESEWELVEEAPVDYDAEAQMEKFFAFASTGTAFPNAKSTQDGVTPFGRPYKVRYGYAPEQAGSNSREFCKKMVSAKKVYRKEDILEMGNKAVNAGFGKGGAATYDIWLYKGGARCHHFWMRKVFMAKEGSADVDAKSPNAETGVANAKRAGAKIQTNPRDVSTKPKDMDYSGFTPEYAQQHGIPK